MIPTIEDSIGRLKRLAGKDGVPEALHKDLVNVLHELDVREAKIKDLSDKVLTLTRQIPRGPYIHD